MLMELSPDINAVKSSCASSDHSVFIPRHAVNFFNLGVVNPFSCNNVTLVHILLPNGAGKL